MGKWAEAKPLVDGVRAERGKPMPLAASPLRLALRARRLPTMWGGKDHIFPGRSPAKAGRRAGTNETL